MHPSGGIYHLCREQSPSTLTSEDVPTWLHPKGTSGGTTERKSRDNDKPPHIELATYHNQNGETLSDLRESDDELDALCSEEYPEHINEDLSEIDYALCCELFKRDFTEQQVTEILRDSRYRTKLDRDDYVALTVRKAKNHVEELEEDKYLVNLPLLSECRECRTKTSEARTRVQSEIRTSIESNRDTLIDAIPSLGKSYGIIQVAAELDEPLSVFTSRHDLYEQYTEWCEEHGLDWYKLPSFFDACPTCSGEHGKKWANRVRALHRAGVTASEIHRRARQYFGEPLPCEQGRSCPYKAKWDFEPEEYDVLVGYYSQAYNPNLVENRTVVFDEFSGDALMTKLDESTVSSAVRAFLDSRPRITFSNVSDLLEARGTAQAAETLDLLDYEGIERDSDTVLKGDTQGEDSAHVLAPLLVALFLDAEDLGNGFERTTVNGIEVVRNRDGGDVTVLTTPDVSEANTVLALDGTPLQSLWEKSLDTELEHRQILSDDERRDYIRNELGISVVRTSKDIKPYSSGNCLTKPEKDIALFEAVGERHESVGLITSQSALDIYGLNEQALPAHGIDDTLYYGNMKGTNEFADRSAGIVSGSRHYGDDFVKMWAALCGERAGRDGTRGHELDYGSAVGNDALTLMRESQVAQAALRFGRDEEVNATVYVNTGCIPNWLPVEADATVTEASEGLKAMVSVIKGLPAESWTANDVVEEVDISKRQVNRNLSTLEEHEYVESDRSGRATEWTAIELPQ